MSFDQEAKELFTKTEEFVRENITWVGDITDNPNLRAHAMVSALTDIVEEANEAGFTVDDFRDALALDSTTDFTGLREKWRVPLQAKELLDQWHALFKAASEVNSVWRNFVMMRQQKAGVHIPS
jgi:hypothetical protein